MTMTCCSVDQLFERVLREGPRADEYYVLDDYGEKFHFELGWEIDRATYRVYSIVSGAHFDELPWGEERGFMRATIYPGDIDPETLHKKRIWIGPMRRGRPDSGIWVANQYTPPVHHYFGLYGQLVPPGDEAMRYRTDNGCWHVFDTEDEVVAAVIICINQRDALAR